MKIAQMKVMSSKCVTCPFREDGDADLARAVRSRTLLQASQICHHPALKGKKQNHLCRGARGEQLALLHRMGLLPEPTDEAFTEASMRYAR